jgi:hypothetical protein
MKSPPPRTSGSTRGCIISSSIPVSISFLPFVTLHCPCCSGHIWLYDSAISGRAS